MSSSSSLLLLLIASSSCFSNAWTLSLTGSRRSSALWASGDESEDVVTYFQRAFYRLAPQDCENEGILIEERVRFQSDPENPEYMQPMGPRTLVLREANADQGMGRSFYSLQLEPSHRGVGGVPTETIATALYLAGNPSLVDESVLELNAGKLAATLLGTVGAGFVTRDDFAVKEDDILPTSENKLFPKGLEKLTITDPDHLESSLVQQIGNTDVTSVEQLDWAHRPPRKGPMREYYTIIAHGLEGASYPETKNFVHHMANRLAGVRSFPSKQLPKFVYISKESQPDLHKLATKGYLMTASTSPLTLEKLTFELQPVKNAAAGEDEALEKMEMAPLDLQDIPLQCVTCTHSPEYAGGGSGELFFPMETGIYDGSRDVGPWRN